MTSSRLVIIDEFRGIAVILMAIFHFCYDLSVFNFIEFDMDGKFFPWFRYIIVTLFFISVGASLYLAHSPTIQWRKFWSREAKVAGGALFITISTIILYPKSWVWFGVLHFIALASLLTIPWLKAPRFAAICGVFIFILFNTTSWFNLHFLWEWFNEPLRLPRGTQDLTRLIPWLGMVLIGVFLGYTKFWGLRSVPLGFLRKPIMWTSKHSLIIYLVHQPPLFGAAWLLHKIIH